MKFNNKRIRELRKIRGLTIEEVAAEIGIRTPSLSDIETGKSSPKVVTAVKLSAFFGHTVEELMIEDDIYHIKLSGKENKMDSIIELSRQLNNEGLNITIIGINGLLDNGLKEQ